LGAIAAQLEHLCGVNSLLCVDMAMLLVFSLLTHALCFASEDNGVAAALLSLSHFISRRLAHSIPEDGK
jgi:hypothetical protein